MSEQEDRRLTEEEAAAAFGMSVAELRALPADLDGFVTGADGVPLVPVRVDTVQPEHAQPPEDGPPPPPPVLPQAAGPVPVSPVLSRAVGAPQQLVDETTAGFRQMLDKLGLQLRLLARSQVVEVRGKMASDGIMIGGEGWWQPIDAEWMAVYTQMLDRFRWRGSGTRGRKITMSPQKFHVYKDAVAAHAKVDPILDYFKGLPKWDTTTDRYYWLEHAFECANDDALEVARWASGYILRGVLRRTYHPGTKLDVMPMLIGPQGIGKSSVLAQLFPAELRHEAVTSSVSFQCSQQELVERTAGCAIAEMDEAIGLSHTAITKIKNMLTDSCPKVRLAYRRDSQPFPLHHIYVGTSNDNTVLPNDPTGLRRFAAVQLSENKFGSVAAMSEWFDENRDQLWALALAYDKTYGMSDQWWEPARVPQIGSEAAAARFADDPVESAVVAWAEKQEGQQWTLVDIAAECELWIPGEHTASKVLPSDLMFRLQKALHNCGWESLGPRRVGGIRKRVWGRKTSA